MSRKNKYILSIILFMTVLVIDQIIKVNVKTGMYLGERIEMGWKTLPHSLPRGGCRAHRLVYLQRDQTPKTHWIHRLPHPYCCRSGWQHHRLPFLRTHLQQSSPPPSGRVPTLGIWLWRVPLWESGRYVLFSSRRMGHAYMDALLSWTALRVLLPHLQLCRRCHLMWYRSIAVVLPQIG